MFSINREIENVFRRFIITSIFIHLRRNIEKYNQWQAFGITLAIFIGINAVVLVVSAAIIPPLSPFVLLITTVLFSVYWYKRFHNLRAYGNTKNSKYWRDEQFWRSLNGWQFEQEVADVVAKHGFETEVTKGSGDGGVDIKMQKDNINYIVQCKNHINPVSPNDVRALWGVKDDFGADVAIMVASSGVTQMGLDFIKSTPNYMLITLPDIIKLSQAVTQKTEQKPVIEEPKIRKEVNLLPLAMTFLCLMIFMIVLSCIG